MRTMSVLCLLAAVGCGTIRSNLTVPAGQAFVLGDNTHRGYVARLENAGRAPVTVVVTTPDGATAAEQVLAPGESGRFPVRADHVTQIGAAAGGADGQVRAFVRGDVGLSMGYEPIPGQR
ncbi:MAG: hypothetical protein KTR31_31125 [Myxococcales bacterium]|nr:hypothetical protein [Myxococcales bacterium]